MRGFTLLEVMIALAVIGGLLVTLLYTMNHHIVVASRHEFVTVATMLARKKLSELGERPGRTEGAFDAPFSDYRFASDLKESPIQGIAELSVTVSRGTDRIRLTELAKVQR